MLVYMAIPIMSNFAFTACGNSFWPKSGRRRNCLTSSYNWASTYYSRRGEIVSLCRHVHNIKFNVSSSLSRSPILSFSGVQYGHMNWTAQAHLWTLISVSACCLGVYDVQTKKWARRSEVSHESDGICVNHLAKCCWFQVLWPLCTYVVVPT